MSSAVRNRLKRLVNSGPLLGPVVQERVERDHAALLVLHEEQPELLRILAELRLGLHIHLVDTAEPVEVVDVGAAEQRPERRVDVVQRDARLQNLAPVDVGEDLRHRGAIERVDAADLRPLPGRLHEARGLLRQVVRRSAAAILQLHREAGARAESGDRRRARRPPRPLPECSCANARFSAATTPLACDSSVVRSSQGLSCTKKKPMFEE